MPSPAESRWSERWSDPGRGPQPAPRSLVPRSPVLAPARALQRLVNLPLGRLLGVEVGLRPRRPPRPAPLDVLRPLIPDRDWRRAVTLPYGVYDPDEEALFVVHDAGMFSCLSVTLWSVCELLAGDHLPRRIDFTGTLVPYKHEPGADVYPDLFETDLPAGAVEALTGLPAERLQPFDHHGDYAALDLETLALLAHTYLRPNGTVTARSEELSRRYLTPGRRYVGVCVRGTDKAIEVAATDTSLYVEAVERLLADDTVDRVLIQTDQAQVGDLFRGYFGDRCDMFDEIPRTRGREPIHSRPPSDGDRVSAARDMLAAVGILSTMTRVVTYTGNIGAWIVLLRGSTAGVQQATPEGIRSL